MTNCAMPTRLVTQDTRNSPCKRRRKCSCTDHQIHRQQPNEKQNKFSNGKPSRGGVRRPENRNHRQHAKECQGKLDGQEKDPRPRSQEVNEIEDSGARQEDLRGGNRDLNRQNKESKEDRAAHRARGGLGNSPHVRSKMFSTLITEILKLYWNRGRNSRPGTRSPRVNSFRSPSSISLKQL